MMVIEKLDNRAAEESGSRFC